MGSSTAPSVAARRLAARDLDGDGNADIVAVVADGDGWRLGLYWGDGGGGFGALQLTEGAFAAAGPLTIADLDWDLRLDVLLQAVSSVDVLLVYFGDADRSFESRAVPLDHAGRREQPMFVVNLNDDQFKDVLLQGQVATGVEARRYVLSPVTIAGMELGQVREVSDLDSDGLRDVLGVLTPEGETRGDLYLASGAADGLDRPPRIFPDGFGSGWMEFADFDADLAADVVALQHELRDDSSRATSVQLVLRTGLGGAGGFQLSSTLELASLLRSQGHEFIGPKAADINGDGRLDLLFAADVERSASACTLPDSWRVVRIAVGNGDGTFTENDCAPVLANSRAILDFDAADFNADGISDVIAASRSGLELLLSRR